MKNNNTLNVNEDIVFEEDRDFGRLIGMPFNFLKQEFKMFSKILLKYAGPFFAISMLGLTVFADELYQIVLNDFKFIPSTFLYLGIFVFFLAIGLFITVMITLSYVTVYVRQGRYNFTAEDVWDYTKRNFFTVFLAQIIIIIMVILATFFFYIPGIYLFIALSFVSVSIIYEGKSITEAISRSFELIKGNWWFTFGIISLFGLIISLASNIFIIPTYVISFVSILTESFDNTTFIGVLLSVILYFIVYLYFIALQQMLVGFLYFRIKFRQERTGLFDRIEAINISDNDKNTTEEEEYESVLFNKNEDKETSIFKDAEETKDNDDTENRFLHDDKKNKFNY